MLRGTFNPNALSRVGQSLAQALLQVGFGPTGIGAVGLILGYGIAYFVRLAHFGWLLTRHDRALLVRWPSGLWRTARRNWQYPVYSAPAALLEATSQLLPALVLAVLFGPAVAGWYGLAQRLLVLPVRLLAQAASQVYMAEATARRGAGVLRLMIKATVAFAGIGLAVMLPLVLIGPQLFAILFGEEWWFAGGITRALVPRYLARFVVTPGRTDADGLWQPEPSPSGLGAGRDLAGRHRAARGMARAFSLEHGARPQHRLGMLLPAVSPVRLAGGPTPPARGPDLEGRGTPAGAGVPSVQAKP